MLNSYDLLHEPVFYIAEKVWQHDSALGIILNYLYALNYAREYGLPEEAINQFKCLSKSFVNTYVTASEYPFSQLSLCTLQNPLAKVCLDTLKQGCPSRVPDEYFDGAANVFLQDVVQLACDWY
jgi:hypothetical protein